MCSRSSRGTVHLVADQTVLPTRDRPDGVTVEPLNVATLDNLVELVVPAEAMESVGDCAGPAHAAAVRGAATAIPRTPLARSFPQASQPCSGIRQHMKEDGLSTGGGASCSGPAGGMVASGAHVSIARRVAGTRCDRSARPAVHVHCEPSGGLARRGAERRRAALLLRGLLL